MRAGGAALACALLFGGCFGACEDHRTPEQKRTEEAIPLLLRQHIKKVADAAPVAKQLTEKRCPAFPPSAQPALAIDGDAVGYFFDKTWDEDRDDRRMFRFVHADPLYHHLSAAAGWGLRSELLAVYRRWLALVVSVERVAPKPWADKKGYDGGRLEGWVVFFDEQGGGPLCQARFSAASSERVERKGRTIKEALCRDLAANAGAAIDAAAARVGGPKVMMGSEHQCWVMGEQE